MAVDVQIENGTFLDLTEQPTVPLKFCVTAREDVGFKKFASLSSNVSTIQKPRTYSTTTQEKQERLTKQFSHSDKEACWLKAEQVRGRDPRRWRRDIGGNIVCKQLRGCKGPFCMDFDHIVALSKGGESTLDNCQVLQTTANRHKGNRLVEQSEGTKKFYRSISDKRILPTQRHLDIVEYYVYGDVIRYGRRHYGLPFPTWNSFCPVM
eukprot:jgi/Galph1/96/GphlegSOOS_G4822.1